MWCASSSGAGAGYWNRRIWYKRRIIASGAALAAALAGSSIAGVPAAAGRTTETVIVTSTGLLGAAEAVLGLNGTILTQYHLINAVDATILTAVEPLLAALPGITVTPDASVSVQSTPESTGPHTPSDAFLPETGATRLASAGDTGQGVTVAVIDNGIGNLPAFSGRPVSGMGLKNRCGPYQAND